ncbi:MAG: alpha/beta hydrolase [Rubrivivax sp.]|nr:alpha/beta hydrolase [Rubrivivax sp.]
MPGAWWAVLAPWWLAGCTLLPTPPQRTQLADALAAAHGWRSQTLRVGAFDLATWRPHSLAGAATLSVYLEGDGFAWINRGTPSADPTPLDPVALRLALRHSSGAAAYLARPCQFSRAPARPCSVRWWTDSRFAPEVVQAVQEALDKLKAEAGVQQLQLVGYSGGGAIAALVAARRRDISRLVTVAGNLDTAQWSAHHGLPHVAGSLNPADAAAGLQDLPQVHFLGAEDAVVPAALATGWPQALQGPAGRNLKRVLGQQHVCCWAQAWPTLQSSLPPSGPELRSKLGR